MEIKTLKDLKKALSDIPDDVLKEFGAGFYEEEYIQLLVLDMDEAEGIDFWIKNEKKYPILNNISDWITNISKATISTQEKENYDDYDEPISSKDKIE